MISPRNVTKTLHLIWSPVSTSFIVVINVLKSNRAKHITAFCVMIITMKLPIFHKYYTVNLLIYLLLFNPLLISFYFFLSGGFLILIFFINIYAIPFVLVNIFLEFILHYAVGFKSKVQVFKFNSKTRFIINLFFLLGIIVFIAINYLHYLYLLVFSDNVEQLRFD